MLWSSLATKDARLAVQSLRRMRPIPAETSWATYVRCHDDIGWAVSDIDARAVGCEPVRPPATSSTTSTPAASRCPSPAARCSRRTRATGDARISGSAAALCGISEARERGDDAALDAGIRRLVLLHAVTSRLGRRAAALHGRRAGARQRRVATSTTRRSAQDNRWMHRPAIDDAAAARRHDPGTVEGRVFGWFRAARRRRGAGCPRCTRRGSRRVLAVDDAARAGLAAPAPAQRPLRRAGQLLGPAHRPSTSACSPGSAELDTVLASDGPPPLENGRLRLAGLSFVWLAEE